MKRFDLVLFLLAEAVLYGLILTAGGDLLVVCSYTAIVLCFAYAASRLRKGNRYIIGGLACTVIADLFLVVISPIQQLWGMIFFLGAQSLYAAMLQSARKNIKLLIARIMLIVAAETVTVAVLREKTDALAVVSICYYANLIVNIVEAFTQFSKNKVLPIALVLFLLCDTVIGLQVMSGAYLPISENSILYRIIYMDFNLSWFFYLPSQVLLALCARRKEGRA